MLTPKVTELSALSAHQREVALVRMSLLACPDRVPPDGGRPRHRNTPASDPLHASSALTRSVLPPSR